MDQLSHPYTTTGKTTALTRQISVSKVIYLLFNRFVTAFLPRSKHLLILWLQSPSAVILEPKKIKSLIVSPVSIYLPWSDGTRRHDLPFLNVESANFFTLLLHFHQEALYFFTPCHKRGVICITEIIDSSPGNLDSNLCFIQPGILYDVLCIEVK